MKFLRNFLLSIQNRWKYLPGWVKKSTYTLLGIFIVFQALNVLFPFKVSIEYSPIILDQDGKVLHAYLAYDDRWRMYVEDRDISPELARAFLFKEDQYFYYHPGVNPFAIFRAIYNNVRYGKRTSGASTITMQLARMLNPKARTYGNKLVEMFRALQLEWTYSKSEILRMYLNLVPYGGNIEGIKSAAILYYQKAPHQLSLAEITSLVVIPNRPTSLRIGKNNPEVQQVRDKWLDRFDASNLFPKEDIADALGEELGAFRHAAPTELPHLSRRLRNQYPDQPLISTFIDPEIQHSTEQLVRNHVNALFGHNIHNAAAIIIDNQQRKVISYVGSADFDDVENSGQVDGIYAIRSPGSTLKPLLYGLAIDEGLISPRTTITDVQSNFGSYQPQNYDEKFHGSVSVQYALANSLNIPAVKVLHELGTERIVRKLSQVGFRQIEADQSKLGLSVVLGGCGARLEELTQLYLAFAREGWWQPARLCQLDLPQDSLSILSPSSSFMITEILCQLTRPDLPLQWHNSAKLPKVAWKTGTSYGRKDAWSIGYNPRFTVGVWVGNFSGEGAPELNGAASATPLLFNIFNHLDYGGNQNWFMPPLEMEYRMVCAESGDIPADFCHNIVMDQAIPGISPFRECQHLRPVFISKDSTVSYCISCLPDSAYVKHYFPNYPPELLSYYKKHQLAYEVPPPHYENCERVFASGALQITAPIHELEYILNQDETHSLRLACDVSADVHTVYWYINDRFIQSANPSEAIFVQPPKGKVKISCADDKGRKSEVQIDVVFADL